MHLSARRGTSQGGDVVPLAERRDVAVDYLASPLSDHICRMNVVVDGGWLIGTPVEVPEAEQEAPRGIRSGT